MLFNIITYIIRSKGSTVYVAPLLNSVPMQTTRRPCSKGLQLIKDYELRIPLSIQAWTTNHQLIEITNKEHD